MKPLISVLIPTYNVEKFVREAIESIANQTYENIEIILVDDCSTDGTYEIAKKLLKNNNKAKVYRNEENLKIAKTLNIAFEISKGQYIARMDGDDISDIDRLDIYYNVMEKNPDIDLIGSSVTSIDENGREIGRTRFYEDSDLIKKTLKYRTPCAHIWIAKRQVYNSLGGYRNIPGAEDYDFLLRAISSGFNISNIESYYGYRVRLFRSGNTLSQIGLKQRLMHKYIYKMYLERLSGKQDSLSPEGLLRATRVGKLDNYLFTISSGFLQKSIQYKACGSIFRSILYAIASCISPHQVSYLLDKVILKFIIKTSS